jgi:hypothetical protein
MDDRWWNQEWKAARYDELKEMYERDTTECQLGAEVKQFFAAMYEEKAT